MAQIRAEGVQKVVQIKAEMSKLVEKVPNKAKMIKWADFTLTLALISVPALLLNFVRLVSVGFDKACPQHSTAVDLHSIG